MALAVLSPSVAAVQTINKGKLFFQVTTKLFASTAGLGVSIVTMHGGENVLVWRDMNSVCGKDARPVSVGSLVHNQRIERHN